MHKSHGNAIWFDDAVEQMGADVMRWLYCESNTQQNLNFGYGVAADVKRRLLLFWNVYNFFVTYARLEDFDPTQVSMPLEVRSILDRWIIALLHKLVQDVTDDLERFDAYSASRRVNMTSSSSCPRGTCGAAAAAIGSPVRTATRFPRM